MSTPDDYEVLDWTPQGFPADVEVRAWPMGMITFHKGKAQATIDTTDMTRDEVVRSIPVALWQIEEQLQRASRGKGVNRHVRRAEARGLN